MSLAFKIANVLLNREFIASHVSATELELVVAAMLPNAYPAVHYAVHRFDDEIEPACNQAARRNEVQLTRNHDEVTCRRCLEMLAKPSRLTEDWW